MSTSFRWFLRAGSLVALAIALSVSPASGQVAGDRNESALKGADYLASVILSGDPCCPTGGGPHNAAESIWALVAAGYSGEAIGFLLDYIEATDIPPNAGEVGMVVMGLFAAGEDPSDFRGTDYVALLADTYDEATGEFQADNFFQNVMGALAHVATGQGLPSAALDYIDANACSNGGFGFAKDCAGFVQGTEAPGTDTTAYVLNLFVAAGRPPSNQVFRDARTYLLSRQNADGGFECCEAFPGTTADDTGLALTALAALGEDDDAAVAALMCLQASSGGFSRESADCTPADADVSDWSTVNALTGMAGSSIPVEPTAQQPDPDPPQDPAPRAPGGGGGAQGGGGGAEVEGSTTVPTNPVPTPTASTRGPVLPDTGPPTSDERDGLAAMALAAVALAVMGAARAGSSPTRDGSSPRQ